MSNSLLDFVLGCAFNGLEVSDLPADVHPDVRATLAKFNRPYTYRVERRSYHDYSPIYGRQWRHAIAFDDRADYYHCLFSPMR